MNINLSKFIVRMGNSVDVDATMLNLRNEVERLVIEEELTVGTIRDAVHAVFDTFSGARLNLAALTSFSLQHLDVTPETAGYVTSQIQEYVKKNSGERDSSIFWVRRGRNGGVKRWSDTPDGEENKD